MFSRCWESSMIPEECLVSRRYRSVTTISNENGTFVCKLDVFNTMPKRIRSRSVQKSKKTRHSSNESPNKRNPIPRSCKNSTPNRKGIVDLSFLSLPSSKLNMGSNLVKNTGNVKTKDSKKEKEDTTSLSSDDLDVVYDLQEDKKNKIYEVITVMSDDETPNQITYERIYAEDPDKRIVDESEIKEMLNKAPVPKSNLNENDIVAEVVKEANLIKEKNADTKKAGDDSKVKKLDECVMTLTTDTKEDSDNEIICVAVLDAKTKAEQKKASVEEICLSSDSESDGPPKVPSIRLQLPISSYPYVHKYRYRPINDSENSFGSNNSNFSFGFHRPRIFPYNYTPKQNDVTASDMWDSNSSAKVSSSDEYSPAPSESPKVLSGDESSSSALSDLSGRQENFSPSSDNENPSSPSSSSDDEEKDVYWKADRELRRKGELRYEEFTDYGKKIHEGEIDIDINTTFTFKVMSYNVLAQTLLEGHMYLYKDHDRRALGWTRRWALIYNEIKDENPEILCLQEVDQTHLASHYAKLLDLGYRWVFKKRTGQNQDGVAVFYKANLFDDEAHSQVEFYQPGVSVLDRDNVGVVIRLRLKNSPNHAVVIATTHLLYNPRRSDVRLAQMQVLLAEIDRLAYNKDALTYYPVILTGDFNLKPLNGVYKLITEGNLWYEGTSRRNLRTPDDNNCLPRVLLPCRLGITDQCQHVDVLEARVKGEDATSTRLYHSEYNKNPHHDDSENDNCSKDDRFESGSLCHGFNFQSVHNHSQADGQLEASTHHDNWVTVDYIFYSTQKLRDGQKKEDSPLQLLSRLRLPTQDECERFLRFLPNFAFGSDHLPLVAKFLLRLQYPSFGSQPERGNVVGSSKQIPPSVPRNRYGPIPLSKLNRLIQIDEAWTSRYQLRTRKYSREFLLLCADSPFSHIIPPNWEQIKLKCPAIVRKDPNDRKPALESRQFYKRP